MYTFLKKLFSEKKLLAVCLTILGLYYFPSFYGYFNPPPGKIYLGQVSWFDPWDINVYVSAIKWSQHFGFNFQNAYTSMPHKATIFYPFYTLLGVVFQKVDAYVLFNVATLLAGTLLLFVIYKVLTFFLHKDQVLTALFLVPLAGGLGWIFYPKIYLPDMTMTPFTFASTFQRGHEAFAVSLYLLSFFYFFRGTSIKSDRLLFLSGVFLGILALIYPFYLLSFYLVYVFYSFYLYKKDGDSSFFKKSVIPVLISLPLGVLNSFYLLSSSGFSNVLSPSLPTPNLALLFLGYGVLGVMFLIQLRNLKKNSNAVVFLNIWFITCVCLSYLPTGFGRYYLRGLFFPLALICLMQLKAISSILKTKEIYLKSIIVVLAPISVLIILSARLFMALGYRVSSEDWSYVDWNKHEAIEYLKTNTEAGVGVLAPYPLSNIIPAHTLNRVYFGHEYQTPNGKEKIEHMKKFYNGEMDNNEALDFLKGNNIESVIVSGKQYQPTYEFLVNTFTNNEVTIFRIKN